METSEPASGLSTKSKFSTAHYAAVVSTIALIVSGGSLLFTKRAYDLAAAKDERELLEKEPVVDVQVAPNGKARSADLIIYIFNRGDINLVPQDITALHLLEHGDLYLSAARQSVEKLSTSLSLKSMGVIFPKSAATMKATVSGVTDGKDDWPKTGVDLTFTLRVRLADQGETLKTMSVTREIKPGP
ncbi:hypothetical protein TSA1_01175 [Bradyrhizobium nitroreducens]|uniref:Uncharacterized protein n=1 Tax=Bradyrhizobium nitroreducens TaxID=709803 RepID=A0A2M6U4K8_9BRAD|nr:hypothetical protein [Bradyrhizobium nitroreducens]PIS99523.1 hypothetical protein TSA1_01175 [Bradyrhizobium nitroreducens]